jgi:hypothetical protein
VSSARLWLFWPGATKINRSPGFKEQQWWNSSSRMSSSYVALVRW